MIDDVIAAITTFLATVTISLLVFVGSYQLLMSFCIAEPTCVQIALGIGLIVLVICVLGAIRRW